MIKPSVLLTSILTSLILSSCMTGKNLRQSDFVAIDNQFNGTFVNKSFLTTGQHKINENTTIFEVFEHDHVNTDSVRIYFDAANNLVLQFKDSIATCTETYSGEFRKKGIYELYLRNNKTSIPPFIPFIYGSRDLKRLRFATTQETELIIEDKWARVANIFMLAGGGSGRYLSYFKPAQAIKE
jgi:hypothetical protein